MKQGAPTKENQATSDAIVKTIQNLEKMYTFDAVRRVCKKYFEHTLAQRRLERTIQQKEEELSRLKHAL